MSPITTEDYLLARAERANKSEFNAILAKVPQRPPLPEDSISVLRHEGEQPCPFTGPLSAT